MKDQEETKRQGPEADGNAPRRRDKIRNSPPESTKHGKECHSENERENGFRYKLRGVLPNFFFRTETIVAACTVVIMTTSVTSCIIDRNDFAETRALVRAAIIQANAAKTLTDLTGDSQVASQRARLAPSEAKIFGDRREGEPVKIALGFVNYGMEGAEDFNFTIKGFLGDARKWVGGAYDDRIATARAECMSRNDVKPGMTIFPTQVSDKTIPINLADDDHMTEGEKVYWSKGALSGDETVVLTGCFTYSTVGLRKHTFLCYHFNALETEDGALGICRIGHAAD